MASIQVEEAIRRQQAWLAILREIEELAGAEAWRLYSEFGAAILTAVGGGTNAEGIAVANQAQLEQILGSLDERLADLLTGASDIYSQAFQASGQALYTETLGSHLVFGRTTQARLESAFGAFTDEGLQGVFQEGYDEWLASFEGNGQQLKESMRRHVARSSNEGMGQRQLAQNIAKDPLFQFENMPNPARAEEFYTQGGKLGKNLALEDRAQRVARDALANTSNRTYERWTTAAGFDYFVNYNPLDERTTDICESASEQQAMTLEQWDASPYGRPRRHHLCRSHLLAVPDDQRRSNGLPRTAGDEPGRTAT